MNWPDPVIDAVARRRVVLLIGSGVSANATTAAGERPPTWGVFLKSAYDGLKIKKPHIAAALKRYEYLEACEYLKDEYGTAWKDVIKKYFVKPNYKAASIHQAIFNLDCRIVASLNFDKIYENYALSVSEGTIIIKNFYDPDIRQVVAGSDRYVLKPHGSVDSISKMIFTVDEYANSRIEHATFYEMLNALLHTHTFLCIGCGLSDPDLRLIFENYRYKFGEAPHFITMPSPFSDEEVKLLQKTRGLTVIRYSPKNHHEELCKALVNLGALVGQQRQIIAESQNW